MTLVISDHNYVTEIKGYGVFVTASYLLYIFVCALRLFYSSIFFELLYDFGFLYANHLQVFN